MKYMEKKYAPLPSEVAIQLNLAEKTIREKGVINRKMLMQIYGFTQLDATMIMRTFLHAHAQAVEWDVENSIYFLKKEYQYKFS